MMFPFAPAPGTYSGVRTSAQVPDAPLAGDDRTGLRVLYSDPGDTLYVGPFRGHIIPANPISLPHRHRVCPEFLARMSLLSMSPVDP